MFDSKVLTFSFGDLSLLPSTPRMNRVQFNYISPTIIYETTLQANVPFKIQIKEFDFKIVCKNQNQETSETKYYLAMNEEEKLQ